MLVAIGAAFAGFLSGITASLVGVGGGVVTTPIVRFLGASPIAAVGSTVPAILPGAISGTLTYNKEGLTDWRVARTCGIVGMVFAVMGAFAADLVEGSWLMIATAVLVLYASARLAISANTATPTASLPSEIAYDAATPGATTVEPATWLLVVLGACAGSLGGLLGVGGGIVLTPGLTLLGHLPVKRAVASSLASVAIIALSSATTHIALGHVDWRFALPLVAGVIPGARLGAHITIGSSERTTQTVAATILGAMGAIYLVREVSALF